MSEKWTVISSSKQETDGLYPKSTKPKHATIKTGDLPLPKDDWEHIQQGDTTVQNQRRVKYLPLGNICT